MHFFPVKIRQLLVIFSLLVASLGSSAVIAEEKINVVASFSILGDLVKNIGGDRINLHTLVGENSDAHVYQPSPADAKLLARAQLVVVNGFGFEGWIDRLIKSSGYRGKVVVAGNRVKTLQPRTKFRLIATYDLIVRARHFAAKLPQTMLKLRAQLRRCVPSQQEWQNRV